MIPTKISIEFLVHRLLNWLLGKKLASPQPIKGTHSFLLSWEIDRGLHATWNERKDYQELNGISTTSEQIAANCTKSQK